MGHVSADSAKFSFNLWTRVDQRLRKGFWYNSEHDSVGVVSRERLKLVFACLA